MCTINWQLLLEYLRVFLSWPPIALIIAFLFITTFRKQIDDLLTRVVEGNFLGQVFKAVPPSQQLVGATEDRLALAVQDSSVPMESEQLPPELVGDPTAASAVAYARNNPAQVIIEYRKVLFAYNSEKLFARIFGTQVELLEFLASRPNDSIPLAVLARFHGDHQTKVGNTAYELRDYVNFLISFGVISVSGPENAHEYKITQHGVEFLSYIKSNYPGSWNVRML